MWIYAYSSQRTQTQPHVSKAWSVSGSFQASPNKKKNPTSKEKYTGSSPSKNQKPVWPSRSLHHSFLFTTSLFNQHIKDSAALIIKFPLIGLLCKHSTRGQNRKWVVVRPSDGPAAKSVGVGLLRRRVRLAWGLTLYAEHVVMSLRKSLSSK